jgi:hypothetical protein
MNNEKKSTGVTASGFSTAGSRANNCIDPPWFFIFPLFVILRGIFQVGRGLLAPAYKSLPHENNRNRLCGGRHFLQSLLRQKSQRDINVFLFTERAHIGTATSGDVLRIKEVIPDQTPTETPSARAVKTFNKQNQATPRLHGWPASWCRMPRKWSQSNVIDRSLEPTYSKSVFIVKAKKEKAARPHTARGRWSINRALIYLTHHGYFTHFPRDIPYTFRHLTHHTDIIE